MNEARNYIVRILNDQYTLCSDEPESHVNKSSELVNLFMREILNRDKQMEHKKVAVLAALRMASCILQLEAQVNELKSKELIVEASLASLNKQLSAF